MGKQNNTVDKSFYVLHSLKIGCANVKIYNNNIVKDNWYITGLKLS